MATCVLPPWKVILRDTVEEGGVVDNSPKGYCVGEHLAAMIAVFSEYIWKLKSRAAHWPFVKRKHSPKSTSNFQWGHIGKCIKPLSLHLVSFGFVFTELLYGITISHALVALRVWCWKDLSTMFIPEDCEALQRVYWDLLLVLGPPIAVK